MEMIEVEGLVKTYRRRGAEPIEAVRGIDLTLGRAEVVAFLGQNGAGKTSTLEILGGFVDRDSGRVRVLGEDPQTAPLKWRQGLGMMFQHSEPISQFSVREALKYFSTLYPHPRDVDEILRLVGLNEQHAQRASKLSGGQRRRLDLAIALVGDPKLVFMDEPTTGFDPGARHEAWATIRTLRESGVAILLTTHYMEEAEQLADRIVIIDGGRIIANDTPSALIERFASHTTINWDPAELDPLGLQAHVDDAIRVEHARATLATSDVVGTLEALLACARSEGSQLSSLRVHRPSLEDIFLELTGKNRDEE